MTFVKRRAKNPATGAAGAVFMLLALLNACKSERTDLSKFHNDAFGSPESMVPDNAILFVTTNNSVFGGSLLRIIEIDGFNVEMTPAGTVMVIFNDDKPGVIGSVGTVCGEHDINICTMGVGQKAEEGQAILAVSLDKEPDAKGVAELGKLDFVNEIYVCRLD